MREVKNGVFNCFNSNFISSTTRPQPEALKKEHLILVNATLKRCSSHETLET